MESEPARGSLADCQTDEWLADLSHDLKTPLTSLKMAILLLREDPSHHLTASQVDLLSTASEDVERLYGLIVENLDKRRGRPNGAAARAAAPR